MTGSEKRAAEFLATVRQVLATIPPPRLAPGTDVEAAAASLTERLLAAYPRRRGLIGLRAISAAYGDSYLTRHARFLMAMDQFAWRYRGQRHREEAALPAPLVREPDLDAVGAELVGLFRLRHRT